MARAIINMKLFEGTDIVAGRAVMIDGGRISAVVQEGDLPSGIELDDMGGAILAPGFIDCQVNGGGGVLLNDDPSVDAIRKIGDAHRAYGTTGFLPTLISDDLVKVDQAMRAVEEAIAAGVPGVLGVHLEGPFLSTDRKGVHDPSKFRQLEAEHIDLLCSLKRGTTLVTLSPENAHPDHIQALSKNGVIVSAGHTNAAYQQMRRALASGVTGFTHLFNAMSPMTSREPGVVGAALEDQTAWCGIIVDGRHVAPAPLKIALRCRPLAKFMLVTDAMPTVGMTEKSFTLQNRVITVKDGVCVSESGTLAGSNLDMAQAVRNSVEILDLQLSEALSLAAPNPAAFLRLDDTVGAIAPGKTANLVALDDALTVTATWIDGVKAVHAGADMQKNGKALIAE